MNLYFTIWYCVPWPLDSFWVLIGQTLKWVSRSRGEPTSTLTSADRANVVADNIIASASLTI